MYWRIEKKRFPPTAKLTAPFLNISIWQLKGYLQKSAQNLRIVTRRFLFLFPKSSVKNIHQTLYISIAFNLVKNIHLYSSIFSYGPHLKSGNRLLLREFLRTNAPCKIWLLYCFILLYMISLFLKNRKMA